MPKARLVAAFALTLLPPSGALVAQRYANVNGIRMYYEIHGTGRGRPLVLIHGGGSTITTTFGRILPLLARTHRVIAVELQAHGHTSDREAPESFTQDAADVAELLRQLHVDSADILGFSNGGHTVLQLAISHPQRVRRLIVASAFYKRDGAVPGFFDQMDHAQFSDMPQAFKDAYARINPDPAALLNMFQKDVRRMQTFRDWPDADIRGIQAPALIVIGDHDIVRSEHAVAMAQLLPHARLAILPGNHGSYLGEITSPNARSNVPQLFVALVDEFRDGKLP